MIVIIIIDNANIVVSTIIEYHWLISIDINLDLSTNIVWW